ncbi:unnamed protein product [Rotaria sp. Silwood1]|nr:unnamed protein product [Rotaria sp. Silwood1]CAF4734175.1 unnamed protein product [Rotaria sp. Silwood1]
MFIFVLIILLIIDSIQLVTAQDCGPNEIKVDCASSSSCQPSCRKPNGVLCPRICDLNSCVCKDGFVRDDEHDLECIEQTQCNTDNTRLASQCGPNEVAIDCAPLQTCQPSCDNPDGTICPRICRNVTKAPMCSENEEYSNCTNPCQPSCEEPNREPCETLRCSEGCVCSQDYLRTTNDMSSPCIKCTN